MIECRILELELETQWRKTQLKRLWNYEIALKCIWTQFVVAETEKHQIHEFGIKKKIYMNFMTFMHAFVFKENQKMSRVELYM